MTFPGCGLCEQMAATPSMPRDSAKKPKRNPPGWEQFNLVWTTKMREEVERLKDAEGIRTVTAFILDAISKRIDASRKS